MKRFCSIFLCLIFLFLCSCSHLEERTPVRAELNRSGRDVVLETAEELQELQRILDSIEYEEVADKQSFLMAPGSISMVIRIEFSDGTTDEISLPCNIVGDMVYSAPAEIIGILWEAFF